MNLQVLEASPLFRDIRPEEISGMLSCLQAKEREFPKGAVLYRAGAHVHELGIVLSGSVSIERDDLWGNHMLLDRVGPGQIFAETYACLPEEALMINAVALEKSRILFLDMQHVLETCSSTCQYHQRLIRNLLMISARKNLQLSRRSLHTAPKSIRGKVLSYLSFQAQKQGSRSFSIPLNRQQMADYLNVDRSALSAELGRMQREGLISVRRIQFQLFIPEEEMEMELD